MKLKALQTTTALLCLLLSGVSSAWDVQPKVLKPGSTYVRVTKVGKASVKFEQCSYGFESQTCAQLGPRESYSIKKLEQQRTLENLQIGGAVLGDILVVGGLFWGGAALGAGAGGSSIGASIGGGILGGGAGTTAGVVIAASLDALNPAEQMRQAKTLDSEVIQDELVLVDEIEEFVEDLVVVLNKI